MIQKLIKFTRGVPPVESFPTEQLAQCTVFALNQYGEIIQQYASSLGFLPLRQLIAEAHGTRPELVLIGQGSLQLLDLAARTLVQPGDLVFVESPSYDRAVTTLRNAGARVCGLALQEDGPDFAFLQNRLERGERPKFIYLIPDFQNPSGCLMSLEKRKWIAGLAQKYGFWIIEDSPYRLLRYRGADLPSIYSNLPGQVMLMSSFSKTICPGLRVGYMIVPDEIIQSLSRKAEDTYINASYINQAAAYEFIHRGWFDRNLAGLKALYFTRLQKMLSCLDLSMSSLGEWTKPDGGFFISLTLRNSIPIAHLAEKARQAGLELSDGRGFFAEGGGEQFIRLPFCGLSQDDIEVGIPALACVIADCFGSGHFVK